MADWLSEVGANPNFEYLAVEEFDHLLRNFYAAIQPKATSTAVKEDGEAVELPDTDENHPESKQLSKYYSKSSRINIRAGLNRHLRLPPVGRTINILQDRDFQKSNQVFVGALKNMRREGKDMTKHKEAIHPEDIQKMYATVFDVNNRWGMIYKVFFEVTLHFARRGREGLRDLHTYSFLFEKDSKDREFVRLRYNEQEKTKQGSEKSINEKKAIMYAQPGDPDCPVATLKKNS